MTSQTDYDESSRPVDQTYPPGYVTYKSADLYFVFSFVLEMKRSYQELAKRLLQSDGGWQEGHPPDRRGKPPFLVIKRREGGSGSGYVATSLFKIVLEPRDMHLIYKENPRPSVAPVNEVLDVQVEAVMRLFDNGAGCLTFKVACAQNVSLRCIQHILSLSQRFYDPAEGGARLKYSDEHEHVRLFDLFYTKLTAAVNAMNADCTPDDLYATIQDREVIDFEQKDLVPQNPYVLSVLEVANGDGTDKMFWAQEEEQLEPKSKELAAILLRLTYPDSFFTRIRENINCVRIPDELRTSSGGLRSFSWDVGILMCFSRVSSLFACSDKNGPIAGFLSRSLLDVLEILRTRWHMSILINALLDQDMELISNTASSGNALALQRIIDRRRQFAYFLDDPLPYIFEGGSVIKIADVAETAMWLGKLLKMTRSKLEILDKLYDDQMRVIGMDEYDKLEQHVARLRESMESQSQLFSSDDWASDSV